MHEEVRVQFKLAGGDLPMLGALCGFSLFGFGKSDKVEGGPKRLLNVLAQDSI